MEKVVVKLTKDNVVVWDIETGIVVDSSGMYNREGKALDAIPLTDFIKRKLREGVLEIIKQTSEVKEDASNIGSDQLSNEDKKQIRRTARK